MALACSPFTRSGGRVTSSLLSMSCGFCAHCKVGVSVSRIALTRSAHLAVVFQHFPSSWSLPKEDSSSTHGVNNLGNSGVRTISTHSEVGTVCFLV